MNLEYDQIAKEQLQDCLRNPNVYVECLVKFSSVRGLMYMVYCDFVDRKVLTPLESIPEKTRREIWEQAKSDGKGRLDKANLIQLSKTMYLIDYLILQWELTQKKQNG